MIDDVLRRGGDREPGRWTGWLAALAVLIAATLVIVGQLPRGPAAPQHHAVATAAAGPVQLAGLGSGAAGQLNKAYLIAGSPAAHLVVAAPVSFADSALTCAERRTSATGRSAASLPPPGP